MNNNYKRREELKNQTTAYFGTALVGISLLFGGDLTIIDGGIVESDKSDWYGHPNPISTSWQDYLLSPDLASAFGTILIVE